MIYLGIANLCFFLLQASALLWAALQSRLSFFTPCSPVALFTDFLLNVCAILFATTLYSSSPLLLNILLVSPAVLLALTSKPRSVQKAKPPTRQGDKKTAQNDLDPFPAHPFLTTYRAAMMVATCSAILAVDFPVFPRRFAKVENWGTSLMDLGVGSFVFSAGLVSARSVLKSNGTSTLVNRLVASIRHSIPLLVLGFVRLYSVKGLDYAEHVTEYGVHWNFFFTLGFLPPFMALCHSAFSIVPSYAVLALMISAIYELALDLTNLKAFIFTAPRVDLISQNREGIFSFFGYLAIFLAGHDAGMYVLPRAPRLLQGRQLWSKGGILQLQRSTAGRLATCTVVWAALLAVTTSYHGFNLRVSRRLANLPYFLWVVAFNCGHLTLCAVVETLCFPDIYNESDDELEKKRCLAATSRLLHAVNRNGLAIFLLANLFTGAVNLTMPTLDMKTMETMAVLVSYMGVLSAVALFLDAKNISIKL
jgi:phosphatidylinositol glycan class W